MPERALQVRKDVRERQRDQHCEYEEAALEPSNRLVEVRHSEKCDLVLVSVGLKQVSGPSGLRFRDREADPLI